MYSGNVKSWLYEGYWQFRQKNFESSIAKFEKVIELYPSLIDSYIMAARAYKKLEKVNQAINCLLSYLKQTELNKREKVRRFFSYQELWYKHNPKNPEKTFWMLLGDLHKHKGEYDKVVEVYSQYLKKKPNDWTFWQLLSRTHLEKGEYEKAIEVYSQYLKKKPNDHTFRVLLGRTHLEKGEYEKAIEVFSQYIQNKPKNQTYWLYLVLSYIRSNKIDQAIKTCNDALDVKAHFRGIKFLLVILYNRYVKQVGNEKTIELCRTMLEQDPAFKEMHYLLSSIYLLLKHYDKALQAINNAIRINPNFYNAVELKGIILAKKKKYSSALPQFEVVVHSGSILHSKWYNLALIYLKTKQYDEGLKACNKCLKLKSDFTQCQELRTKLYMSKSFNNNKQDFREIYIITNLKFLDQFL